MGYKSIYERFIWFDDRVKQKKYPNTTSLSKQFEVSIKTAQRDIDFMRDRLNCPLFYDPGRKGFFIRTTPSLCHWSIFPQRNFHHS
jgi:hypothetical protein